MKHKLYTRLLSLALAVGLVIGMLPSAAAVDTVGGSAGQAATLGNGDQVSFTLPVKLYGDDGTDLSSQKSINIVIEDGQTVPLPGSYLTDDIRSVTMNDKTYSYDYVAAGFNGDRIDQLQAGIVSSKTNDNVLETHYDFGHTWREVKRTVTVTYGVWFGSKPSNASGTIAYKTQNETYTLTQTYWAFRGWEDDEGSQSDSTFSPVSEQTNNKNIYFMYSKDGTLVPDKELTRDKIVTLNDNGTYDLTLTVSGAAGSITNPQKLDVVFIVDKSGSMAWDMNHDDSSWGHQDSDADETPRLTAVKNAIRQIASELDSSETIDARYSLVSFSGSISGRYEDYYTYNDATVNQTWTDNLNTFTNQLNRISADGGTNYEAGLYSANQELLDSTRPGAMTAVIFLSDGEPTYYYDRDGYTTGSGSSYSQQAMDDAKAEAAKMAVDFFYAIGVGDSYDEQDGDYADTSMPVYMQNLVSGATQAKSTQFFDGNNSDALNNIFDQIGGDITSILCENVTVTDTLSENVEIAAGEGVPVDDSLLTITVTNKAGDTVATGRGSVYLDSDKVSITAHYDPATRQITLNFPPDYKLNKDYTYMVTAPIRATEKAYENYRNNGNQYPDTGDQGTGTHAGQAGLYTNNKATVDYTYNGKNYSAEYPMPVIQLKPGTLTITKQITGDLTEEQIAALEDSIKFEVELNGVKTSYPLSSFMSQGGNSYTMSIGGLSPNTQYTVTESGAEIPGYVLEANTTGTTGTIAKGSTATAAFTNKYTPDTGSLTITKTVEGLENDSATLEILKKQLTFTVTGPNNYSEEIVFNATGWKQDGNTYTYTYTINNLPTGEYTVTESGYDLTKYGYNWTGTKSPVKGTVNNDDSVTVPFTNTYTPANINLTITKQIQGDPYGDGRDMFSFRITCIDCADDTNVGKVWYVHINGNDSKTITLPVGKYKVEELSNMHYKFVSVVPEPEEIPIDTRVRGKLEWGYDLTEDETITFTNEPVTSNIPSDGGGVENHFDKYEDGKIVWKPEEYGDDGEIQPKPTPEPSGE